MKTENEHPTKIEDKPSSGISANVDLEAYFQRIGFAGGRVPTLSTLRAIHALHPQTIAFENLNPLLRLPVLLNRVSIQQKLVQGGRGGYCFEHNLLLWHVLVALGFKVKGLAARVCWNVPEGVVTARGHMLLLVEIEGRLYIADVGFGGLTLTAPLLLAPDIVQETPHEPFRLVRKESAFELQAHLREVWKSLYRFDLQEQLLPDYEVSNWYLSNHPTSHFITSLIAARVTPDRRYALRNQELTVHYRGGNTERHFIGSVNDLQSTLENIFGLKLTALPQLQATLQKVVQIKSR